VIEDDITDKSAALRAKEKALRDALEKPPQSAGLSFRLAVLLQRQDRHAEALGMTNACMAIEPENLQFLRLRVRLQLQLGHPGEAENTVRQELQKNPDSAEPYLLLALVHVENLHPGPAQQAIDAAMQRAPEIEQLQRMKALQRRTNALLRMAEEQPLDWLKRKLNRRIAKVAEERENGD